LRIDSVIPFIDARYRALRLFSAVVGMIGVAVLASYAAIGIIFIWCHWREVDLGQSFRTAMIWVPLIALTQTIFGTYRAWLYRRLAFRVATSGQLLRAVIWAFVAIGLGYFMRGSESHPVAGILAAQVSGDTAAIVFYLINTQSRERRLMIPWSPSKAYRELQANLSFIGTLSLGSILSTVNQNIPLWAIGYAYGLQPTGWFSATQRVVASPIQFSISTLGVAFTQRMRLKRERGEAISRDVLTLMAVLVVSLAPIFLVLWWLAHSGWIGILGKDWEGMSPTLSAMLLISFGSIFYGAVESLPLLFRLNRFLLGYYGIRLAASVALASVAVFGVLEYGSWIYFYAVIEMLLYGGCAAIVTRFVWRADRASDNNPRRNVRAPE
jgi:O-antigen/teichoic acid export membrane protein